MKKVPGAEVVVHPYSGEAGAIGAALVALEWWEGGGESATRPSTETSTPGRACWSLHLRWRGNDGGYPVALAVALAHRRDDHTGVAAARPREADGHRAGGSGLRRIARCHR